MVIGISVGILIGVLTGIIFIVLLRTVTLGPLGTAEVIAVVTEMGAIPGGWFCGSWTSSRLFADVPQGEFALGYVSALTVTFLAVTILPLLFLIWQTAMAWRRPVPAQGRPSDGH